MDLYSSEMPEAGAIDNDGSLMSHLGNFTMDDVMKMMESLNTTWSNGTCEFMKKHLPDVAGGCPTEFDQLICWLSRPAETLAVLPCLPEIKGIKYNTTQNVSRWCHGNGTWDYADYNACEEVSTILIEQEVEITTTIYLVGYINSLVALMLAVWIFISFKDLRCLRNVIHTNLMCTYIFTDFTWVFSLTFQMYFQTNTATCMFLQILLHYFHLTNFFWMFVEGLYLYMLVVQTFAGENIKLHLYASIGWGGPAFFVIVWAIVKTFATHDLEVVNGASLLVQCPWMQPHPYDWIYKAPTIGILLVNLIFLFVIMWVLITKLRSAQTVETQQYRKAAKALLVLIPLLGITYVLVIAGPTQGVYKNIHDIIRAILISTQGFTVALFYCFLNTEVQNTIRHHFQSWKTARSLTSESKRYKYNYSNQSKDWSPRSRTESIRETMDTLLEEEGTTVERLGTSPNSSPLFSVNVESNSRGERNN